MSRASGIGTSYLQKTIGLKSMPHNLSVWFHTGGIITRYLVSLFEEGTNFELSMGINSDGTVFARATSNIADEVATGGSYSTNTWHHLLGRFPSGNARVVHLDNSQVGTNSNIVAGPSAGYNRVRLFNKQTTTTSFRGRLQEVFLNTDLTGLDVKPFSNGYSALMHKEDGLILYARLIDDDYDEITGVTFTKTGVVSTRESTSKIIYPAAVG